MADFQPSRSFLLANKLVTPLVRLGLPMGTRRAPMTLLTVKGRKSGIDRTIPVALETRDEGWLLVAVYGTSDWSKNLEAAGRATITSRRRTTTVEARRLPPPEAGPILKEAIMGAPAMIRRMTSPYFLAGDESSAADWELEAEAHPVFILTRVEPDFD
jgi:deazaflavin-dependent oxidoreductase (nitroreductase family)